MDTSSNSSFPPQNTIPTNEPISNQSPPTIKSASTASSATSGSKKKLIGGIIALLLITGTIGIGSYMLRSRQTTLTRADETSVTQCQNQGGVIRQNQCDGKEIPIGTIGSGGDGLQLCCKNPNDTKTCPLQCIPVSEAGNCEESSKLSGGCGIDEVCCTPKTIDPSTPPSDPVGCFESCSSDSSCQSGLICMAVDGSSKKCVKYPDCQVGSGKDCWCSLPLPITSPPPAITSPIPTIPSDSSTQCPDPKQNLNVKVECLDCAD